MNNFVKTLLVFCFAWCLAPAAFAATYTVTKIADTNDGACDADCSLREAIVAANATADNDAIEFSATFFNQARTITLSGTELTINNNGTLSINGVGANLLTIAGGGASRVFLNNTGAVTEIKSLRVTGGNGVGVSSVNNGLGGAIRNTAGTLTLTNLVVSGNTATNGGGLSNGGNGVLNVVGCTVSGNTASGSGGGMQNFSGANNITRILNSTFSGNTSNSTSVGGGAIQANGVLFISNSTFSGNTTTGDGGAIFYNGQGITLTNTTIANNTANSDTGGFYKDVAANTANLRNNLIAGNTGGASPDIFNVINSLGNNLIQAVGASSGWIASDILNQPANIAPLANNGGATQTHALLSNSPAINAGNNCVTNLSCAANNPPVALTTDQRGAGFPRQVGAAVDIGAFEFGAGPTQIRAPFDFDGDGRTDFAVFRPSSGTWFLNRSTAGLFAVQFGLSSDRLTPADFDGDGRTDIAVWREASFANFFILNSSNNTFRAEQFGTIGDDPRVIGDWDGDGRADLAVYRSFVFIPGNPPPSIFYYRPSGAPGVNFRQIQWGLSGDRPVVGDYDGDGRRDVAVFRASTLIWSILQSSNNGQRYERWGFADDIQVPADYDGDGRTDLAIFRNGLWAILQSSNNQQRYQQFGQAGDRLVPGDYDGDGRIDLAIWRGGVFYVLRSNGNQAQVAQFGSPGDVPVASAFVP